MTGEIINLRHRRKLQKRSQQEQAAAENRRRFGRTKAERRAEEARARAADSSHQGHLLDGRTDPLDGDR